MSAVWTRSEIVPIARERKIVPFHIENQDTCSMVKDKIPEGKTMRSLCSPVRVRIAKLEIFDDCEVATRVETRIR